MSRQRRGARLLATDRILEGVSAVEICDLKSLARVDIRSMSRASWTDGGKRASGRPSARRRKSIRHEPMGSRHPNPRRVKIHRNYSVEDIARLFGIHKNTVRNWLKQGLATIANLRPLLALG